MKNRTKKQLIVCLTVYLVLSFLSAAYAEPLGKRSAPVTVVNTNSNPVPVTEVRQYPQQRRVVAKFPQSSWIKMASLYTVPLDRSLVIEYFSCHSNTGSYDTSYSCWIEIGEYSDAVSHYLPTTPYGHSEILLSDSGLKNLPAYISAGQRVQIYVDPGTEVLAGAKRQNRIKSIFDYPEEYMEFSFSGYLVDIAQ